MIVSMFPTGCPDVSSTLESIDRFVRWIGFQPEAVKSEIGERKRSHGPQVNGIHRLPVRRQSKGLLLINWSCLTGQINCG